MLRKRRVARECDRDMRGPGRSQQTPHHRREAVQAVSREPLPIRKEGYGVGRTVQQAIPINEVKHASDTPEAMATDRAPRPCDHRRDGSDRTRNRGTCRDVSAVGEEKELGSAVSLPLSPFLMDGPPAVQGCHRAIGPEPFAFDLKLLWG